MSASDSASHGAAALNDTTSRHRADVDDEPDHSSTTVGNPLHGLDDADTKRPYNKAAASSDYGGGGDDDDDNQSIEEEKKSERRTQQSAVVDDDDDDDDDVEEDDDDVVDDDGMDHADDDTPPGIPWQPQDMQSTCEFTHVITDYAAKRDSGCKKAEYSATTVDDFGNRWRLIIYVNGNGRASNHHLSLFLQVADADDLPFGWKKHVSYVLTLEHPDEGGGSSKSFAKRNPDKTFKLCPKAIDWGWSQFITSDRIQQDGFVADDQLIVRAAVTVKNSSVNIDEEDAELYLKCAVEEGDAASVKLCLEQGASVNCKFKDDLYTPLHTACSSSSSSTDGGNESGSMKVLHLLLEQGADCNASNKWRETPLLIAANNGHRAAVEALLQAGANPSLCSEAGWSALTFAAHKGYDDIVALLLRANAPVDCKVTEDSSTPLHKACAGSKLGHSEAVKLLIKGGADVHALNKWRETPLLTAANHGQTSSVAFLLGAGADPCKCTDTGWSPLSIAAYKGHDDVVRLLLDEGAPTEEEDPTLSALLQAATKGLPKTVDLLLRHGADHTVTTKKGDTALSILVEQNLIDAAVDMVTEHNASIPRCSRDRKKVQHARLLIQLRMKQLERASKNGLPGGDDSHDSGDGVTDVLDTSPANSDQRKDNSKNASNIAAEQKAKEAEEALLMELEQEESKTKKEEADANMKRAKKKKKERERKAKLDEERREQKRQQEEHYAAEREKERQRREADRIRREKEVERERKLQAQQEQELAKAVELEQQSKRKERRKATKTTTAATENSPSAPAPSSPSASQVTNEKWGQSDHGKGGKPKTLKPGNGQSSINGVNAGSLAAPASASAVRSSNRRWETANKAVSATPTSSKPSTPMRNHSVSVPMPDTNGSVIPRSVSLPGQPIKTDGADFVRDASVASSHSTNSAAIVQVPTVSRALHLQRVAAEHPSVALFRKDKIRELLSQCAAKQSVVDDSVVRRVILCWSIRAAHGQSPYVDPVIPSWTDDKEVVVYFERQLITESRRFGHFGLASLKEAGSVAARCCMDMVAELQTFQESIDSHHLWNDSSLGMSVSFGPEVIVSWANKASVILPTSSFAALRERFVGDPSRFLATVFSSRCLHESYQYLRMGSGLDFRLPDVTVSVLGKALNVTAYLNGDVFCLPTNSVYWGQTPYVDLAFGGRRPFATDPEGEQVLASLGGSIAVMVPLESIVASRYVQRMLEILETASDQVPLSFALFLHSECFVGAPVHLLGTDISQLDSRLGMPCRYLQTVEILAAGSHSFLNCNGNRALNDCNAIFLLLQNGAGKHRFSFDQQAFSRLAESLATGTLPNVARDVQSSSFGSPDLALSPQPAYFTQSERSPIASSFNSAPPKMSAHTFQPISGRSLAESFSPVDQTPGTTAPRRGRLFDLVDDDVDDDQMDVDVVSGMLNNLGVGLFQGNNGSQTTNADVDIEAISLMGIGHPSTNGLPRSNSHAGRFR